MNVETVVDSLGRLDAALADLADKRLQQDLKSRMDEMYRTIFDHCKQKSRIQLQQVKFPSNKKPQDVPSLADPRARNLGGVDSIF